MTTLPISAKIKSAADALRDPKAAASINKTIAGIIEGEIWRRACPEAQPGLRAVMRSLWNPYDTGAGQIVSNTEAADRLDKLAEMQALAEPVNMTRAQYNMALLAEYERGKRDYVREQCSGVSDVIRGEEASGAPNN